MKIRVSRRGALLAGLLLLGLFLVRPQAGGLRKRVSQSISLAVGRQIEIGSLHLRFLPRLGFELENLIIHDDPAFGAEPLLRAADVTAWLRVTALLRGRVEIASLSLTEASLNLTRDPRGKWNLEDLLERTARISVAPTAAAKQESRPTFPYIEAVRARINFKVGTEKTHFALTDAEFALWQESENAWSMRLKAQPIRTDANLTDTGVINIIGTWQRSRVFYEMPVQFSFQWKQAQIGQVSKLIYGTDKGWRGNVAVSGTLAGSPANLKITGESSIDDFRREDVLARENLRLDARCAARYSSLQRTLSDIECNAPAGDGSVELKGSASGLPFSEYGLSVFARRVPAQTLLVLLRRGKGNIANDLVAGGTLNATLLISRSSAAQPVRWTGDGELRELALSSASTTTALTLGRVPLSLGSHSRNEARVEIGPVNVGLGRPTPLEARASLSLADYQVSIHGDAAIKRLLQVAHMLSVPAPTVTAEGNSSVDFALSGTWRGSGRPAIVGTAQLRSVRAEVRGWSAPLLINGASLVLDESSVKVQNLNASAANAVWRGSLEIPRPCAAPETCGFRFSLRAVEVSAAALNQLLNVRAGKQSWYRFLTAGGGESPYLLRARASGKLVIDRLILGKSVCTQFSAESRLESGEVTLSKVRGQALGGNMTGEWRANFSAKPPTYSGSGSFDGVELTEIARLMNDGWIDGSGAASYELKASGWTLQDLVQSTNLSASFSVKEVEFPHIVLTNDSAPLRASIFSGKLFLQEGKFSFQEAKLENADGVYKVSGTASLNGALNLKMSGESAIGYNVSGTFIKTRVSPITTAAAQASLKP